MVETINTVDLHTHTTCSDGLLSPQGVIELAASRHIGALAITDHDTVEAYQDPLVFEAAQTYGIELVQGVEISTVDDTARMHVLGLEIDVHSHELQNWLAGLQESRIQYSHNMAALFAADGWNIDEAAMSAGGVHTKASIADALIQHPGNQARLLHMFGKIPVRGLFIEKLMNPGNLYYMERPMPTPADAIEQIHKAGGVAILAHPVAYMYEQQLKVGDISEKLENYNFDGIEAVYYYFHKSGGDVEVDEIDMFKQLADKHGILISGGSDFHGATDGIGKFMDIGYGQKETVPDSIMLGRIKQAARTIRLAN